MTDQTNPSDAEKAAAEQKAKADAEKAAKTQAAAEAKARQAEEAARPLDQTVAGGRYQVGGKWVNANGQPIDEDGNVVKE